MDTIFNTQKTLAEYKNTPLLLGPPQGLFDTVHKKYPKIWGLYKEMKSLDWSEDEFDYSQCNSDFKTCPKDMADMMIETLAWQWEADSVASRSIISVLGPFITSSELWAAWSRISDNECIHAATYSEIVRMSFDNPNEVLKNILEIKEALSRLTTVGMAFSNAFKIGHEYSLGMRQNDQETYNAAYLAICALLMLERIQFMASFAITFTICSSGLFQPIGKAVQKICQDELEVHCELDKAVLLLENKTERGKIAKEQLKDQISAMFHEIVACEMKWLEERIFANGRQLIGTNLELVKEWTLFNAKDVAKFLEIETDLVFPKHNPMPSLEPWINMNKQQAAPQEQDLAAYKVGVFKNDDDGIEFDDF
ncbi:MAG TPA: ribonucleotide-diphosphate reductase subunit beta [Methanosarcina sp.]|nr:ribonucleotide-diphosphate reductase subunit beta [Methanosarcina sp.]